MAIIHVNDKFCWVLLVASNAILSILFIVSMQQFCITDTFKEKPRLRRMLLVTTNIFCFLALNSLVYLSALYPQQILLFSVNIKSFYSLFEAFTMILAFHTFRILIEFIIHVIYDKSNIRPPKWFEYFLNIEEFVNIICILCLYSLNLISNEEQYKIIYYTIMDSIIVINAIFIVILIQTPLNMLHEAKYKLNIDSSRSNRSLESIKHVKSGICYLRAAVCAAVMCGIMAFTDVMFYINPFHLVAINFSFFTKVMHSVIVIALGFALILWTYKTRFCCTIPPDSVCQVWCCSWCCCYNEYRDGLLGESTRNTNRTSNVIPIIVTGKTVKGSGIESVSTLHSIQEKQLSVKTI